MMTTTNIGNRMRQAAAMALLFGAIGCWVPSKPTADAPLAQQDREGFDIADGGDGRAIAWLPVLSEPVEPAVVMARWGDVELPTLLDTGATDCALPTALIDRMRVPIAFTNAFSSVTDSVGVRRVVPTTRLHIIVSGIMFDDVEVVILPSNSDVAAIGMDVLSRLDVHWRPDESRVGVRLATPVSRTRPTAVASSVGTKDAVAATMIIDTGSSRTAFPSAIAVQAGLPSRMASGDRSTETGVFGEQRQDGFWVLQPMVVVVGNNTWVHRRLLARERLGDDGLLGWDVLSRSRLQLDGGVPSFTPFQPRRRSTSRDITARWDDWSNDEQFARQLEQMKHLDAAPVLERCVRLEGAVDAPKAAMVTLAADRGDGTSTLWRAAWHGESVCVAVPALLDVEAGSPVRVQWIARGEEALPLVGSR
jgi:hypothetical protein